MMLDSEQKKIVEQLNIINSRLRRVHFKDDKGQYTYGFLLIAMDNILEFYHNDKDVINEWVNAMKLIVIVIDVKADYGIGKMLGRGNFARVHLCHPHDKPNDMYALKTLDKTSVKKSRRSIVSSFPFTRFRTLSSTKSPFYEKPLTRTLTNSTLFMSLLNTFTWSVSTSRAANCLNASARRASTENRTLPKSCNFSSQRFPTLRSTKLCIGT